MAASVAGTLGALALLGLVFIYSGVYNVAATDEHNSATRWALRTTTVNSIEAHAEGEVELPQSDQALTRGFKAYDDMCVRCHGAPGVERSWIGKGIRPTGPDLGEIAAVRSPAEILWTIEHGIKFTGMPALAPTHSRDQMLELTAFVVSLKDMSPAEYAALGQHSKDEGPTAQVGGEAPDEATASEPQPSPDDHGDHGHAHNH